MPRSDTDALTVLCIDDDITVLGMVAAHFGHEEGHQVLTTDDPEEALGLARSHRPDCILLDWSMPTMSGLALLQLLRGDGKTRFTPIFMLTGRTKMEDAEKALGMGATGYFTKPINFRLVSRRIQGALRDKAAAESKKAEPKTGLGKWF